MSWARRIRGGNGDIVEYWKLPLVFLIDKPHAGEADAFVAARIHVAVVVAYYWDHRDEIQLQMGEETAFVEQMKRKHPSPLKDKDKLMGHFGI
jgi:hypothetical protein